MDLRQQLQESLGDAYMLERELGGGGMSRVFVADERRLNRKVVVKVLSPELAAGVNAERFEREMQLAASLQQANIVPILAAGETAGMPFYTMPFVEGESLRARLTREGKLPIGAAIDVLRDVSKALAYAHERGVVHRDIKPDNVLLSGGTAVVTDFGIAKALSAARRDGDGANLTQLGTSLGTPAYMAPEQAAGDPTADHRADLYSLGCLAYELLTGQSPFHGRAPARMLAAHISETPVPVTSLRPDTPAVFARLVSNCLEKDPGRRPQRASEVLTTLDAATTATGETTTAPTPLSRTLGMYGVALVLVALLARASVIALGVPDWVFPGALLTMAIGLPVTLYAWHSNRTPGARFTWKKFQVVGASAAGLFAGVTAVFMILRAMGVGPVGSLMAAGRLEDRGRLIVTSFPAPDSSLGNLVTEAVRTNLGQSRVVSIVPPVAVGAALQRMQRPMTSPLTLELAREIAQREGVMAIVDGSVRQLGTGYALSLRLVSADSARELAAYQETADSPRDILQAIDKLTRKLRGRIGESLRDVRSSPALEQVTTPSIDALRIYAEANRMIDMGGSPIQAAERLREAVRIDTAFAMAWRKLGVALSNSGLPRASVDSALERAYRFRDRLTERERLLAEGTYFQLGTRRDRRRAIRAYEALLALDPNETGAANNLGTILSSMRESARAESLFKARIEAGNATAQQYTNLIGLLVSNGKVAEAEQLLDEFRARYPSSASASTMRLSFLYMRDQLDSMETLLKQYTKDPNVIVRVNGFAGLTSYLLLRGRPNEGLRLAREAQRLQQTLGEPDNPLADSLQLSWLDLLLYGDTVRAVRRVESTAASIDVRSLPFDRRPYMGMAQFYASAGQPARARTWLARDDAETPDSSYRLVREPARHATLGYIAMAEGRYQDAVRELWRADTTFDGPEGNCAICLLDDLGTAWDRAGAADSAIYYWERYLAPTQMGRQGMDAFMKPFILKRLGELYEAKGDIPNAVRRYREFLALWSRPEPKLQDQVDDVRFRLSRLADTERKTPN
ncbi:MAG: protein kinase [Gemmatimonadota bacterium]